MAGLELKRELAIGSLRRPIDAAIPVAAAVAGSAVPAGLYLAVAGASGGSLNGWAVPVATDIAFALAVLAVIGSKLPTALRAFLLTLAVVDDLLVVLIIAAFFSTAVQPLASAAAITVGAVWALLQHLGLTHLRFTCSSPQPPGGRCTKAASTQLLMCRPSLEGLSWALRAWCMP